MRNAIRRYIEINRASGHASAMRASHAWFAQRVRRVLLRALGFPADFSIENLQARHKAEQSTLEHRLHRLECRFEAGMERQARSTAALAELHSLSHASTCELTAPQDGPLITVIMPTHRRAEAIEAAIHSVRTQTYQGWELIVVNDGGDAATAQVVTALAEEDSRIRHLEQEWLGGARARNLGLANARGEVIAYLDDDNAYYPTYLAALANAYAEDPATECAYTAQLWIGDRSTAMATFDPFDWERLFQSQMSIDMNVFSHRKSMTDRLGGFDERLLRLIDWDLVLRYTAHAAPLRIPVLGVRYDWGTSDRISNVRSDRPSRNMIREKYVKLATDKPRVLIVSFNYPQLSESYVHAEVRWLLTRGVHVDMYSMHAPLSPGEALVPVRSGDLAQCIRDTRPDIVHVHWMSQTEQQAEVLAACGVPVTLRAHGFDYSDELAERLIAMPWLKRIYPFPNLMPANSGSDKLIPLAAAVDTSRHYPPLRKNRRLVLRAGACLPTKDLGLLIEVAASRPEYRFVLVLSANQAGHETAEALQARNASLGSPAEILFDVQYETMGELMREAGIYLHTFGYEQPFGQPISIAEAMACGTIPLIRASDAARAYAGDAGLYYESAYEASTLLGEMLEWDDSRWSEQSRQCIEHAYDNHADSLVLQRMLDDWKAIMADNRGGT